MHLQEHSEPLRRNTPSQPTRQPADRRVSGGPTEIPIMSARVALLATIRQLWPELQAWVHARTHARPSPPRLVHRPGLQARIRSAPDRRRHTRQAHAWTTATFHATSCCDAANSSVHVHNATAYPCGLAGGRGRSDPRSCNTPNQGSRVPAAQKQHPGVLPSPPVVRLPGCLLPHGSRTSAYASAGTLIHSFGPRHRGDVGVP